MEYGRNFLTTTGRDVMVIADGRFDLMKVGGISLDLATIAAVAGAPVTFPDDTVVGIGNQALRFGQILTRITASGKYGPYDPVAADGRQTLTPGECFILNRTWIRDLPTMPNFGSLHPPVFDGGTVWRDRLLVTTGAHSLAAGPTFAEFVAAFPRIGYVKD
jgi:hypothetical protein